jgi:hypothetical protein
MLHAPLKRTIDELQNRYNDHRQPGMITAMPSTDKERRLRLGAFLRAAGAAGAGGGTLIGYHA